MVKTEPRESAQSELESMSTAQEIVLKTLTECGAVLHGHFLLASGRHSDVYVEKFRILEQPKILEQVCKEIVNHFRDARPDVIAGPSTGGMIVAYEVARQFGVPAVYVETEDGKRVLGRGGHIKEEARVLLVDDVLTTGVSLMDVLPVIAHANLIGVGVLIDRSEKKIAFGADLHSACKFEATTFSEEELPDWLKSIPITTPGTRAKTQRIVVG